MSKIKKLKIALLIVFILLLLSLTYAFFFTNILTITNINYDNEVIISQYAQEKLDDIYINQAYEIPTCLGGILKDDILYIYNVKQTEIIQSSATNATYIACPQYINEFKVVATLHNHPSGNCIPSSTDLATYANVRYRGENHFAIYCREGYVFYTLEQAVAEIGDV